MTDAEILAAIDADATATALANAGNDAGCAARLAAILPPVLTPGRLVTERTLYDAFADPADAEAVLATLAQVGGSTNAMAPIVARVASWLVPDKGGVDMGDPKTRDKIDAIAQAAPSGFTPARVAVLKAIGQAPPNIAAADVSRAMFPRRPGGKVS